MARKSDFEKMVKKTNGRIFLYIVCVVLAAVLGYLVFGFFTKNDTFVMITYVDSENVNCELHVGDEYVEKGAKCISFGKEESVDVKYYFRLDEYTDVTEVARVDTSCGGIYYVKYTCDNFKYSGVELIRVVKVLENGGVE